MTTQVGRFWVSDYMNGLTNNPLNAFEDINPIFLAGTDYTPLYVVIPTEWRNLSTLINLSHGKKPFKDFYPLLDSSTSFGMTT